MYMKKILNSTKRIALIVLVIFATQKGYSCPNRGNIVVSAQDRCDIGRLVLKLTNHTTTSGTQYFWQMSNDGGLSWGTMAANSGKDTQLIPPVIGRLYRCLSVCPSGNAYSDTMGVSLQNRTITVTQSFCSTTAGGNDSLLLKVAPLNASTDLAFARYFKWQVSTTNGILWDDIGTNSDSIKIKFTPNIIQYRAYITSCPLTGPVSSYPTNPPNFASPVNIGLDGIGITISDKDCVNDTAKLSLTNVLPSLSNFLKYNWYRDYVSTGKKDSFLKVKVNNIDRIYNASVKLCNTPFPSKDSVFTNNYELWVSVGSLAASVDCNTDMVEIDYDDRNLSRKSVHTYWMRSTNATTGYTLYNVPVDSVLHTFPLTNGLDYYYKVYSKFCSTSSAILDSTNVEHVQFKIDTGQLKATLQSCTNDSVYLKLLNYKDSSSFTLVKKWQIKRNGNGFFEDYTQTPLTDTTITFRMNNGWNSYRKSISLCPGKYSKSWYSTEAKTFLPYQAVYDAACAGNMTVRVLNDTVKVVDYTGTTNRSNSTFAYQWLRSTNKVTTTVVAGATNPTLTITQADKNVFFKRLTRICSANTFSDTTLWSNINVGTSPVSVNGQAQVTSTICLNDSVQMCIINGFNRGTDTPTFVWQYSPDNINWVNMSTNSSNDSCTKALVTPAFQYFRRLTFWCPSGIVDSSKSVPLIYIQTLPWSESFTAQVQFGKDILLPCWRGITPVCGTYNPVYTGGQIWSRASGGKSDKFMANWGPAAVDPKMPPGRKNDIKLMTPAFNLKRGKVYRISFWHKEDGSNICWDSLYVTWGQNSDPCMVTNKFGEKLTRFSFDQYNRFWSDFSPTDDGIYYFAVNLRENSPTTGEVGFDDFNVKEVQSCEGKNVAKGRAFAPSKIIDRSEEPSKATTYDKDKVTHQYCLHDTIMLTYEEGVYSQAFDYHGMTYQFWKKRSDKDWKIEDTFFKPVVGDTLCHITNRSDYHVMNVLVTDTHTWYKIVATCQYDGKQFHSDSLLINGTHSLPYCEDWEGPGRINHNPSPMPQKNSQEIVGKVPSFAACPTCWAAFPQSPLANPQENNVSLHTTTLPFLNLIGGVPQIPQLEPDNGWNGNNVVINGHTSSTLGRKVLVMPAMRLYKGRGYRVSFRWTDNRRIYQSPWGNANQDLDSLYLVVTKGNQSGKVIDSFPKSKMVQNSLYKNIQSNILEAGSNKFRTFWADYTPTDTGTYYFGIVVVAGPANGNPYRFYMDYFCVDTMAIDDCNEQPKFVDPLRVRVAPDGKIWSPGDTSILIPGVQWCVGNDVNLELDFGFGPNPAWKYGWKMYWQRTTNEFNPRTWTTIDSSNGISYKLSYKFQDFRLVLSNSCKTKGDTIGPFHVLPGGNVVNSCGIGRRETFLNAQFNYSAVLPQCWDVYPPCRVTIQDDGGPGGSGNEFHQRAKLHKNYLDMDFISNSDPSCPMRTYCTAVPPGYGVTGGVTYRFSFWYKDNGISVPVDSIVAGFSYSRPTDMYQFRLLNKVNNDIVRNSKTNKWRYYTTEVTPPVDTALHFKVITYNMAGKRMYRTLFDDFDFKPKQDTDVLVIAIDSPNTRCGFTTNEAVQVTVMNTGNKTLANVPLKVKVGDTGTPVSYTIAGTLSPNQTRTVVVPGVNLSPVGNLQVHAWTDLTGDQYRCDDTFTVEILHNEMPEAPTDTIDSVCVCNTHTMYSPYKNSRWYRNVNDITPISLGDKFTMDSVCKDTSIYYSTWSGAVDYTYPPNFSYGAPSYATAPGGLHFDNLSKDTIMIDSVMVYANSLSTTGFNITLTQFLGAQQVTVNSTASTIGPNALAITKLGRQWLPIKFKIPPGTDYKMTYPGGASLAVLPNFIFIGSGSATFDLQILGDEAYPATPTAYKYFFNWKLIRVGCESSRIKKTLKVIPTPKFQLKDTARVCSRPIFQLCGPSAPIGQTYTYLWSAGDTTMCKGVTQTGWYQLSVTNDFGCQEKDSTQIIVDPSPEFTLGPDTSFCRYSPYTLKTGLDSANNVVTWSDNQAGVNITILNPGTYVATAYNTANFCTAKDTILVNRRELPVFSLGNDRVFCGSPVDLGALAPNLPTDLTYSWSPPAPNITTTGKYWVTGTDIYGCKSTDTIQATIIPNPIFDLGANRDVCGSNTVVDGPVGNYYYTWSTTSTARSITIAQPGTYYLTITDKTYGCQAIDSIKITFKQVPIFDLGADVVKCGASYVIQGPTGLSKYFWKKPNETTYTQGSITMSADKSGVYYLRVDNDCYDYTDSVRITLKTTPTDALSGLRDTFGCRQVLLKATDTLNYTSIQWSAPLNSTANTVPVNQSGTYSVSLTNECGYATKAVQVRIDQTPTADFKVAYPDPNPNCMTILLTNLSTNGVTYLWSFGDNLTSTTENPLHEYVQEGNYLVTLKTYNSCGFASKTLPIKRRDKSCSTLSINGLSLEASQIYVFPNPAKENTQLLGIGLPNGLYKLSVKNLLGQSVYEKEVKVINTEIDVRLDIANFANGEYLVELSGDNETIVRKLQVIK